VDPIKDGVNWYVYVNADPVNFVDAWGLLAERPGDGTAEEPNAWEQSLAFQAITDDKAEAVVQANPYAHMQPGNLYAPAAGTAYVFPMDSEENPKSASAAYGNTVVIVHNNDYVSGFAHMDDVTVVDGQKLRQGEIIGSMGATTTHPLLQENMQSHGHWAVKENVTEASSSVYWDDSFLWDSGNDLQLRIELEDDPPETRASTGEFVDPQTLVDAGEMIHPANTRITSPYGPRDLEDFRFHYGIDYAPIGVER